MGPIWRRSWRRSFGNWTVAVNGAPWRTTFNELVSDLRFSPDGGRVAAVGKRNGAYFVIVDDSAWAAAFDMVFPPVHAPGGGRVAARVQKDGKYTYAVDGRLWPGAADAAWDPVFSPDGSRLLLRTIEHGVYHRRVLPVADL